MKRRILFVSTNRADIGILTPVYRRFGTDKRFSPRWLLMGEAAKESAPKECRGIVRAPVLQAHRSPERFFAQTANGAGKQFDRLKPGAIVVVGDRFEMLAVATVACLKRIPIIHLHGGETTFGAMDEAFRHAISKMAALHFVSHPEYGRRVMQLGEEGWRVQVSGAPSLEALLNRPEPVQRALLSLGLAPDTKEFSLVSFHPETLSKVSPKQQAQALIRGLKAYRGVLICTSANNDPGGREINEFMMAWAKEDPPRRKWVKSLGAPRYWALLSRAELLIGNSSSGILEAPSFGIPVVNIGDRQLGRIRATNVIDCSLNGNSIARAVERGLRIGPKRTQNPFLRSQVPSKIIVDSVAQKWGRLGDIKKFIDR